MITRSQAVVKRAIDIVFSALGLILLSPLIGLIALAVRLDSAGPSIYTSQRLGRDARLFTILKFRSMYPGSPARYHADGSMLVEKDDARITRVGQVLRVGLDELPQLWNVLKGDMSLIGPRPDLPYALELYRGEEALRLRMRPGITGWAQVKGRTDIPWRQRLALDLEYVNHYSLRLDAHIALATLVQFIPLPSNRVTGSAGGERNE